MGWGMGGGGYCAYFGVRGLTSSSDGYSLFMYLGVVRLQ